jgi:hypothetical protein
VEGFLARFVANGKFTTALLNRSEEPVNTDDRNFIEFQAARSVGRDTPFEISELRSAAEGMELHRPAISGAVDWERVEEERLSVYTSNEEAPPVQGASLDLAGRARAHGAWVKGRLDDALAEWKGCCGQPVNSAEVALVAEVASNAMEPPSEAWLDLLAIENRVESMLIRARLRWKQGRPEEAAELLVQAYEAHRKDPWPLTFIVARSLTVAELLAAERPDLAPRIYTSLSEPFSIYSLDHQRRSTALAIARRLEDGCGPRVVESLRRFEPWIPWERAVLTLRAQCYEEAKDPLAATAKRQLAEFLAAQPKRLLP